MSKTKHTTAPLGFSHCATCKQETVHAVLDVGEPPTKKRVCIRCNTAVAVDEAHEDIKKGGKK